MPVSDVVKLKPAQQKVKHMKTKEAKEITGSLGKPSKMPGYTYGLPAEECKTGAKLAKVPGSVCANCYALKGMYRFKNVKAAQYNRLASINKPGWVRAMAAQISSKKVKYFRWHDSGDVQDLKHLLKIFRVCKQTPDVKHWMPTREAWTKNYLHKAPDNLVIRFSGQMVDQPPVKSWPNVSTVITSDKPWFGATSKSCPAPKQGNKCLDCRACWNKEIWNISYYEH